MIRILLAQLNFATGDITGNTAKILNAIAAAEAQQADIIIFPELALTGYNA
jgi:predicted amidohydrolase